MEESGMKFSIMCPIPDLETRFDQQTPAERQDEDKQLLITLTFSKIKLQKDNLIGFMPMKRLVRQTTAKTAWAVVLVTPDLEEEEGPIRKALIDYLLKRFGSEKIFIEEREQEGLHYLYLIGKLSYLLSGQMGLIINDFIKNFQLNKQ